MNVHVYISLSTGAKTSAKCTIRVELFYACIFLFFSVPDSAPENITYKNISSGEIELSFLPPNSPNGIIQKYTIYLKKSNGSEERIINTTSLTQNIKGKNVYNIGYLHLCWQSGHKILACCYIRNVKCD